MRALSPIEVALVSGGTLEAPNDIDPSGGPSAPMPSSPGLPTTAGPGPGPGGGTDPGSIIGSPARHRTF